jgi:carboxypeptidase C (cathepsin A)
MHRPRFITCLVIALIQVCATAPAQEKSTEKKAESKPAKSESKGDAKKPPAKKSGPASVTHHSLTIGGKKIDYTAEAATITLKNEKDEPTAEIFYIAYTRKNAKNPAQRPLTFSFNGGPGSSSVWMHMGLLGPKRVKLQDTGFAVPPPYELVDNEFSLLDETDLVFIDPVGTGFSRATKPEDNKNFYGVNEDARSVGEFIRLYVTKNSRWPSPKFLIGESYGTTRAAALSRELIHVHRMNLNGMMLVSTVLNFQTIWGSYGNDLPHVLFLPSYTATAWYHKKLAAELQAMPLESVLKQAEEFATNEFNRALMMGSALTESRRKGVVKTYARLTGLSEAFVDASNLRIPMSRFAAELLRDERKVLGRFDSRFTSPVRRPLSENAERDPSADAIFSAYASTFNHYLRTDLDCKDDRPYHILANAGSQWNWDAENHFTDVADRLADSMTANPFLKVHVSNGYYDLATPYFATRYTFNHLRVPAELAKNITQDDYTAGHMMYLNLPDLKKQKADLAKFVRDASRQSP